MLKAPLTGSSWKGVPGTFVPFGTTVPSTIGPSNFVHSLNRRPSRPHPSVSRKTNRAVSNYAIISGVIWGEVWGAYGEVGGYGRAMDIACNILNLRVVLSSLRWWRGTRLQRRHGRELSKGRCAW
jgi:hypothetical protein